MKSAIYILSASDRYNYGDLLFPIISIKELSKYGNFNFNNVAIIKSDLSAVGALPTLKYNNLYRHKHEGSKPFLLIAGGEVLGANWARLYSFLYPSLNFLFKFISNIERAISKILPFPRNPLPFVPIDKRITKNYIIIFHAVGGKKVGPKQLYKRIDETFCSSPYISIRESASHGSIKKTFSEANVMLTPDGAIIMSDFFPYEKTSDEQYIAFQVGHYKNGGDLDLINNELKRLYLKTKLPIHFIPIGNCPGHDDILSLKWLQARADYPCEVVSPDNLNLIMKAIANSSLFIGTSLHGIITAMAFSVPYIALNPKIVKLNDYIQTWAPGPLRFMTDFNEICDNSLKALTVDKEILIQNATWQKKLARDSFKSIASIINGYEE